jgi:hypothetical protein
VGGSRSGCAPAVVKGVLCVCCLALQQLPSSRWIGVAAGTIALGCRQQGDAGLVERGTAGVFLVPRGLPSKLLRAGFLLSMVPMLQVVCGQVLGIVFSTGVCPPQRYVKCNPCVHADASLLPALYGVHPCPFSASVPSFSNHCTSGIGACKGRFCPVCGMAPACLVPRPFECPIVSSSFNIALYWS